MSEPSISDRPRGKSLRPLRTLWPFITPYRRTLIAALTALLIASAAMLAMPVALRFLIDNGFIARDMATVNRYFGWFLLATVVFSLFAALRYYLVTWLGERVVADIRNAVYARIIRMDPAFFEVTRTGEVLSRLTTDTTLVQSISGSGLSIALRSMLSLLGGLVMLVLTSPQMAAYTLVGIVVVVLPVVIVGRYIRKLSRQSQDRVADTSGLAGETLNAMQTVQSFTLEDLQVSRYAEAVKHSFLTAVRRIRMNAMLIGLAFVLVFCMLTLFLWAGSRAVMAGTMTAGQLGQFLMYAFFVGSSATALSSLWGEIQRAAGAMERLSELLQAEPEIKAPAVPEKLPKRVKGRIRFDHVSFSYPSRPETLALDDFSLEIEPGDTLAIVGPSGAGKSTSFQLLLRFYDVSSGSIQIDGKRIEQLDPQDLRHQIGLVPQETVLFGESALENIRYGRPDATEDEVRQAAVMAEADEFIRRLPDRYNTFLGERGTRLSGGQRQRIAIARAILKDPPVLLLDEATSSLDAESERLVQAALESLMQNRTTLVIAHRLATVKKVDRILVMNHGRIEAVGSHGELTANNELYARLAQLQFGDI
ncbi:MAG: ATP-binding cassette domain-containing protein [Xanthomonadales bacterium]|nr:ATP-binding cassette domain-containing protein [Gammaproteobacteria bacterium]MBT8052513.1 ATP-binding cassette domain-containing protein [Gammaproteobacteria bacterium]NND57113.1 ATP-binding cassette domain-containing protein [Xanthomonadales bacterium]NNK52763.1 ATP-binding cassette domain-containing protein [Xanthomonadales bacterium]